jgi:hypothetical protein
LLADAGSAAGGDAAEPVFRYNNTARRRTYGMWDVLEFRCAVLLYFGCLAFRLSVLDVSFYRFVEPPDAGALGNMM